MAVEKITYELKELGVKASKQVILILAYSLFLLLSFHPISTLLPIRTYL